MLKFSKSLSKTLIISVALATFLTSAIQVQNVQAATSKTSKGKGGIVIKKTTLLENKKAAAAVSSKILALPKLNKITLANKTAVIKANIAYKALTDIQKSLVKSPTKATLIAAVSKIEDLSKVSEVNTLINALPKVNKITLADAASVNKAYAAFKSLSKSQKKMLTPSNVGKITAAINKIASLKGESLKALIELNSGKKAFSNFAKAGVTGATDGNGALYFAEIAKAKATKGSALTLAEIQVIVNTVNKNVIAAKALALTNAGTEVFADFAKAGITGAVEGNKAAYDSAIAAAKATKGSALTLAEVQAIVDTVNKNISVATALAVTNAGTEVFADFAKAGVTGAVEGNKVAYDSAIAQAKIVKGSDLTLVEVQAVVDTVNKNVIASTALVSINAGTEVFADFATAGITGAAEGNKAAYDSAIVEAKNIKASDLTLAEVQVIIDTVNKNVIASTALVSINAGTEVFADFATAGITGAAEENKTAYDLAIVDAKNIKGSDLTLEEVQAVVNTKNQAVVDLQAAQVVINQIAALDNTKETYAADVVAAKEAYEMLTDAQRLLVTNYDILVNAVQPQV